MISTNSNNIKKHHPRQPKSSPDDDVSTLSNSSTFSFYLKRQRNIRSHLKTRERLDAYLKTKTNVNDAQRKISYIPSPTAVLNLGRNVDTEYHVNGVPANITIDKLAEASVTGQSSCHEQQLKNYSQDDGSCAIREVCGAEIQDTPSRDDDSETDHDANVDSIARVEIFANPN